MIALSRIQNHYTHSAHSSHRVRVIFSSLTWLNLGTLRLDDQTVVRLLDEEAITISSSCSNMHNPATITQMEANTVRIFQFASRNNVCLPAHACREYMHVSEQ